MRKFLATNKQTKDGSFLSVRFFLRPYDFLGPMLWKKIGLTDGNFPIFPSDFFHSIGQKIGRMQKNGSVFCMFM
jgi:hypothetical protein